MKSAPAAASAIQPLSSSACPLSQPIVFGTAVDAIYKSVRKTLLAQALFITKSRHAAEEVVQDVFTYAWQHSGSYDPQRSAVQTWLSMLCHSRALDYLRAQKSHPGPSDFALDPDATPDLRQGPEALQCAAALRRAVTVALLALPAPHRQLLALHYFADLSHTEISGLMGMPIGTVKTNIRRAKVVLSADRCLNSFHYDA